MKNLLIILSINLSLLAFSQKNSLPPAPVYPVPTDAQLAWHDMELNAFVHFTTNTFTDLEWGMGNEAESVFNPTEVNTKQWVGVLKKAGFKGIILTCKHHDGFCLWPTKYTEHSIKNSPYKNGKGDIVRELSDQCKVQGVKFGVYLSPWDRNRADYGQSSYIDYYRNQLKELFTNYGPIFEMWFDGANGGTGYYGGANEKRSVDKQTYYEWPKTLDLVRSIQPNVIFFSDAGPGVRWCGNEEGRVSKTNWNTIDSDTLFAGKAGVEELLGTGSENGTHWVPAESDVSIRPGWFYHAKEDNLVKTPEQLFAIYLNTVGRGSLMLLNVPPDRRGLFHENDVKALEGFRALLDKEFKFDYARLAKVKASSVRGNSPLYSASNLIDGKPGNYWATNDGEKSASIELTWKKNIPINYIVLQEYIKLGQRVKAFNVEAFENGQWKKMAEETTIGHKRILKIEPIKARKIRINITASKACPVISSLAVY
ncbi:MAG: glycoside hydrolase family 29 [Bacteroidales bacterium 45-6]|nr:MAG: glycoside hydrolase family 29 [Bacteroidales bacterium 45-6]